MTRRAVAFGVDRVVRFPGLLPRARRVGLVSNHAARLAADPLQATRTALLDAGVPVTRLFAPEHGLASQAADGARVPDASDDLTGLPIVSLYGDRFDPPAESLTDLDYVIFDVPDVGARFYTYIWTLSWVLEACARTQTPLVVLDRPNPLGGSFESVEGPMLDEKGCASFVGRWAMPIRHSLTVGELATYWAATRFSGVSVQVVKGDGWTRDTLWPALGVPWIATSPAISSFESALLYPGLCLFEGTNLSVGRGTETPFQVIAAPWLDPRRMLGAVEMTPYWGVRLVKDEITPSMEPYAGHPCATIRVEVTDPARVRPVALGLALLAAVIQRHPHQFEWAPYRTAANPSGAAHFERLVGRKYILPRLADITTPVTSAAITRWTSCQGWAEDVRGALLYE